MANLLTGCRILCSLWLLFVPLFSPGFYVLYLVCGLTDMIDGTVARKTHTDSRFGAGFDTAADFVFTGVSLIRLLPAMDVPVWMLVWVIGIAGIKIANAVSGFVRMKRLAAEHTVMNKVTGLLLFLLPLTLGFADLRCSGTAVCLAATAAAVQEGCRIRKGRETR